MDDISNQPPAEPDASVTPAAASASNAPRPAAELRQTVQAAMLAGGLSQAAAAKEMGFSGPALNQWLQGKYKGDNASVDQSVGQWLDARERRQRTAMQIPTAPAWFDSPTARDVLVTLAMAQADGDIVTVTGVPGVGKTKACERYRDSNPNVWLATMRPHCSSLVLALRDVAKAVGIRNVVHGGAGALYEAIEQRVSGTGGLLIVDEAQHLKVQCFDEIRSLHDSVGIAIAFVGNETVSGRMAGGGKAGDHAQVYSRVGGRRYIPRAVKGDVRAQVDAWGLECADCIALLEEVAARAGALRLVTKTIRRAAYHAGGIDNVTVERIKEAWRNLGAGQ